MAAIITSDFRKSNCDLILDSANSGNLYIGIGRSDVWRDATGLDIDSTPPLPTPSPRDLDDVKSSLIGLKKATYWARVAPRVPWVTGRVFNSWKSSDYTTQYPLGTVYPHYCVYQNRVYICVKAGSSGVSVAPVGVSAGVETGGDGYTWAYVGELDSESQFNSTQFMEVPADPVADLAAITTATGGKCYSVTITSAGSGYTSAPTVAVQGNGTGLAMTTTITDGKVTGATITNSGSGYTWCKLVLSGDGTGAVLTAELAPKFGFGYSPKIDLPSWFVGLGVDLSGSGDETNEIPVTGVIFRQVSVLRVPTYDSQEYPITIETLKSFTITGANATGTFQPGKVVQFSTGAKVFVDHVVYTGGDTIVRFHQNSSTAVNGIAVPTGAGTLAFVYDSDGVSNSVTNTTAVTVADPEYMYSDSQNILSGEVIFVENLKKKTRSSSQNEEVRIIIQL